VELPVFQVPALRSLNSLRSRNRGFQDEEVSETPPAARLGAVCRRLG